MNSPFLRPLTRVAPTGLGYAEARGLWLGDPTAYAVGYGIAPLTGLRTSDRRWDVNSPGGAGAFCPRREPWDVELCDAMSRIRKAPAGRHLSCCRGVSYARLLWDILTLTHIVFSTKNREAFINDPETMHKYIGGIVRNMGGRTLGVGGPADHVHILVGLPPKMCVADAVRTVKSNSSKWVNEKTDGGFAWQTGYGAFSVSRSAREQVQKYIASQLEHHRATSFQEEFLAFLQRHEIGYDPRYIWD